MWKARDAVLWLYKEMCVSYTIFSQQWPTREAKERGSLSEDSGEHPSFAYSWEADLGCAWEGLLGTSQISEGQGSAGLWIRNAREAEGRIRASGVQADGVPSPITTLPKTMSWRRAAESRLFLKIPGSKANTGKHCYFQCTLSCFSNCPPSAILLNMPIKLPCDPIDIAPSKRKSTSPSQPIHKVARGGAHFLISNTNQLPTVTTNQNLLWNFHQNLGISPRS